MSIPRLDRQQFTQLKPQLISELPAYFDKKLLIITREERLLNKLFRRIFKEEVKSFHPENIAEVGLKADLLTVKSISIESLTTGVVKLTRRKGLNPFYYRFSEKIRAKLSVVTFCNPVDVQQNLLTQQRLLYKISKKVMKNIFYGQLSANFSLVYNLKDLVIRCMQQPSPALTEFIIAHGIKDGFEVSNGNYIFTFKAGGKDFSRDDFLKVIFSNPSNMALISNSILDPSLTQKRV